VKQRGSILLLDCGHSKTIPTIETVCNTCIADEPPSNDPFTDGFRAGIEAKLGFDLEALRRLSTAWLREANHAAGCQDQACSTARRVLREDKQLAFGFQSKGIEE